MDVDNRKTESRAELKQMDIQIEVRIISSAMNLSMRNSISGVGGIE